MRDELNVVSTFTLALKFAFIFTRQQSNFSLLSSGHLAAPRYVIRNLFVHVYPTWNVLPGNVLRFDVSTRTIPHISAGVSLIGSQILIEGSVPDITKVRPLGHFTCSCYCGTNGLFIKHRVTSLTCAYHSLQASSSF